MDSRNITYMFYGFSAVWIILAAFVVLLVSRERAIRKQLDSLRAMLDDRK